MKQIAVDNVTTNLTGAGLQASVTDKINDMLLRAVTSGAKYADLTKELHEHLTKTDKGSGALSKYANTYATTAISQYAGENNKILTDDLGLEWFEYVGSNIETTREFCDHLTEKRYIHKSEIKTILKGKIDGHQCEIYEKTGLPKGMIEGTTEQNFQVNCGGWNCRHQLVPVAKEAVPLDIRAKFEKNLKEINKSNKEIKTQGIRNNNVIKKNIKSFYEEITPIIVNNENEIRLTKTHETAMCFDSKGKILIDKRGESTSVNFVQSELGKMKDCVLTHNHPRGWGFSENSLGRIGNSFSPADIYLAISANLSEIRAVTPTYTFSMKRPKTGWGISVNELNKVINEEHQKCLSNFNKIINNAPSWHKDVCAERASALHYHIVMKNLSKRLGFIYEKTKSL